MTAHSDLPQIRYVTGNYRQIQGLRTVAYGAAFAAGGLVYSLVPSASWALSVAVWVGVVLNWLIGRYYERTFGRVEPNGSEWGAMSYATRIPIVLGAFFLLFVVVAAGLPYYILLGLLGLGWSIGYALYLHRRGGLWLRAHWAVASAIIGAVSLVMILPLPVLVPLHSYGGMRTLAGLYLVPMGLVMIVCGFLDHRLLLRTFASPEEN